MKRDLGSIYTAEWFEHDFAELGPEFDLVAAGIDRWATVGGIPRGVLDMGCGPGLLVAALRRRGFVSAGFDGSPHAIEYATKLGTHEHIWCEDILTTRPMRSDVVICTEVAEHLPAEDAPALVRRLTSAAVHAIIFTSATPGQGGHDHINEQPREYWRDLFEQQAWVEDQGATAQLQLRWVGLKRLSHMIKNVQVYR